MHADFLFITAEIAAAFAGFASLVAIISTRGGRTPEQEMLDFYTLRNVLFLSLMAIGFALLPNLLERLIPSPQTAWRVASAGFVAVMAPYCIYFVRLMMRAYRQIGRSVPWTFKFNAFLLFVSSTLLILTATSVLPAEAYLVGVANVLYNAGFGFVRLFVSLKPTSVPD